VRVKFQSSNYSILVPQEKVNFLLKEIDLSCQENPSNGTDFGTDAKPKKAKPRKNPWY